MGRKYIILIISIFLMLGCGSDKAVNDNGLDHPLMNTCWEYYDSKAIDIGSQTWIGDLRIEFSVVDTTYFFTRSLLNTLPGIDSTQLDLDKNGNVIVVKSDGNLWFVDAHSSRVFTYLMHNQYGEGYSFTDTMWIDYPQLDASVQEYILDGDGNLKLSNAKYASCGSSDPVIVTTLFEY
jgi:hypothetical protein